jgi:NOL1/NOP2/sun family putative RNA methylase
LAEPATQGLRVNPRHGRVQDLIERRGWVASPVPWCPEGVVLAPVGGERHPAGRHAWHEGGAYYLQDPAAMGVVPLLDPRPGDHVLDLAAAPGGKATHIAGRLGDRGLLWAHDATPRRADALVANLERWGATVAATSQGDAAALGPLAGRFDRVLLDAPCSGEGMFRKSDAARERWSPQRVDACALLQLDLLDLAADLLRPGGVLVYATCTFAPEEDEATIEALLRRRPDLELEDLTALALRPPMPAGAVGPVERASARWWPHRVSGDGHFAARLRRDDAGIGGALGRAAPRRRGAARGRAPSAATAAERGAWSAFATDVLGGDPLPGHDLVRFGDGRLVARPPALAAFDAPVRTAGVTLGRLVGERAGRSRFEPHHALSRVLPDRGDGAARLDLAADDPNVAAYLMGSPLSSSGIDGWALVRAEGVPLGWVKGHRGGCNNHYPRGLRRDLRHDAGWRDEDDPGWVTGDAPRDRTV